MSKRGSLMRRDSIEFDKLVKKIGRDMEKNLGVSLPEVRITAVIARRIDSKALVEQFNILKSKRGRPKLQVDSIL